MELILLSWRMRRCRSCFGYFVVWRTRYKSNLSNLSNVAKRYRTNSFEDWMIQTLNWAPKNGRPFWRKSNMETFMELGHLVDNTMGVVVIQYELFSPIVASYHSTLLTSCESPNNGKHFCWSQRQSRKWRHLALPPFFWVCYGVSVLNAMMTKITFLPKTVECNRMQDTHPKASRIEGIVFLEDSALWLVWLKFSCR